MAEVNKRLDQEGKRATSAEAKIRQDFDKRLQAFRVKLDSDTQALKTYLETDVKTTIESINTALHEGNLHLKTDIDAQATRLSELNDKLGTELAGLRQTDTLHGKSLEEVTLSLAKLRDVLGTTGTQLGTKLDSQGKGWNKRQHGSSNYRVSMGRWLKVGRRPERPSRVFGQGRSTKFGIDRESI